MKKTDFGKTSFAVAMSQDTGCIVMVRTTAGQQAVVGTLTREQSLAFAESILVWGEEELPAGVQAPQLDG